LCQEILTKITDLVLFRSVRDFKIAASIGFAVGKTDGKSNLIRSVSHVCYDASDVTARVLVREKTTQSIITGHLGDFITIGSGIHNQ
jgi:hypothetical protein